MTLRELEGEYLLSRTSLNEDMQGLIDIMVERCRGVVAREQIEEFASLMYRQGYQNGKVEAIIDMAKKGE